ncbi:MAG: iron-containing alcohol dehydrogenase [Candidatus Alcyoniella australis]|nr:iron-containing alcohol dehydrogenase [Candidatus Alcyoniella australis]
MLPDFFEFWHPTRIVYGPGLAKDFSAEISDLKIKRPFVVTDEILYKKVGLVQPVLDGITSGGLEIAGVFDQVPPNSEIKIVKQICDQARDARADSILAIGGGSVIDSAKAANILFTNGGDLLNDYSGAQTLTEPLRPLIVIPTTAGTGSEVTMVAVILDEETHTKNSFVDKHMLPNLAVLDPEMTLSLPAQLTAATGMDALTHAMEAFWGLQKNPASDAFASQAVRMLMEFLPIAVSQGDNLEARSKVLVAATFAGAAFSHSMVGVVHSMAHATGGLYGVPHGVANAILLPYGMEYNLEEVPKQMSDLAQVMRLDTHGLDEISAARKAIDAVRELQDKLAASSGLPIKLSQAGVPEDGLEKIAAAAVMDGTTFYNPREVEEEAVLETLKAAY